MSSIGLVTAAASPPDSDPAMTFFSSVTGPLPSSSVIRVFTGVYSPRRAPEAVVFIVFEPIGYLG